MSKEEQMIISKIIEIYGSELQGMTSIKNELIIKIKNKEIKIKNYIEKGPEEVIKEIKKESEEN